MSQDAQRPPADGGTGAIADVRLTPSSPRRGEQAEVSWTQRGVLTEAAGFTVELRRDGHDARVLGSGVRATELPWTIPLDQALGVYAVRVSAETDPGEWAESEPFEVRAEDAPAGQLALLSAVVREGAGDRLRLRFSSRLERVRPRDFRLSRTCARVVDRDHPDWDPSRTDVVELRQGSDWVYELTLDEHLVPSETPTLVYWRRGGQARAAEGGVPLAAIDHYPVDNRVERYGGDKTVRRIPRDADWDAVRAAFGPDTIVAIERGFSARAGQTELPHSRLYLTAVGSGDDPRVVFEDPERTYALTTYSRDHVRIASLDIVARGLIGVAFRDESSFCGVIGSRLVQPEDAGRRASVGVRLYSKSSRAQNPKNEGNFALFNEVRGFSSGITYKGVETADRWRERHLGGTQHRIEIAGNVIRSINRGGSVLADAISTDRMDFNDSRIHHNRIVGWYDDGWDSFQARRVIFEYNYLFQGNDDVAPGGGSGLKVGGPGAPDGTTEYATSGYSGGLIVRYNTVARVRGGSRENGLTISGGDAFGRTVTIGGRDVTYGRSLVYGNIVFGTERHALQLEFVDGAHYAIFNNIAVPNEGGRGLNGFQNEDLGALILQNNVFAGIRLDARGRHNVFLAERAVERYAQHASDQVGVALSDIFDDPSDLVGSPVRADSPTIDAGHPDGIVYVSDHQGTPVRGTLDIGAREFSR